MNALNLALGFVFISNAVFLVAAGALLYRILHHTRHAHEALVAAADETRNAGKQLQHVANASHDRLNALVAGAGGATADGVDEGASATREAAAIDKLTRLVEGLLARQGRGSDAALADAGSREGAGKDDRSQRSELARALAQNHRLKSTIDQLRLQLEEAHKTVAEMQRDQRTASTEALANMRLMVDRLHQQLELTRRHARDAQKRARSLEAELLKAHDVIQNAGSRAELGDVEERLNQMQRENQSLSGEVGELKELIQRTLREKHFIEDRYLLLEGHPRDAAEGQPMAAAALQAG